MKLVRAEYLLTFFQYEDKRVQEFTEPDYDKVLSIKAKDRKFLQEWLAFKASTFL